MREVLLAHYLLVGGLLLPASAWAQPVDSMPLKVIGKSFNESVLDSHFIEPATYTLSLRNDSELDITAWRLVCLYAEGDGHFATAGIERDAFMRYEMGGGRAATATGGLVPPGAVLDAVVAGNENMAHPYGATSCRVDAVIFADGSYTGDPRIVDALFARRERLVSQVRETIGVLNMLIEDLSHGLTLDEDAALEVLSQGGRYSEVLGQGLDAARAGDTVRLDELLERVKADQYRINKHRRRSTSLESEVSPASNFGGEPSGCELGGAGKGADQSTCSGFSGPVKYVKYQLTASCSNPCTGETWTVNLPPGRVDGDCPNCGARIESEGVEQPHLWTRRYLVEFAEVRWAPISEICFDAEIKRPFVDCYCPNCGDPSPILITLTDGRYQLTDAENGVRFDLDADGKAEQTAWTAEGSDEGFLALDRDMNGTIDDYMEIFGDHTPQVPSNQPNGWRALAVWDDSLNGGNEDGVIDANDRIFSSLLIWVDSNHNGFSEPEELSSLEEAGVEYLELDYGKSAKTDQFGNQFRYWSKVGMANGRTVTAWDVFFVHL